MTTRNSRADVVRVAGRMFADRGYHGTSMRDLGRELGLQGSSLYSHIRSKEDLLVAVVLRGAALFEASARQAESLEGTPLERLRALIAGHVDVVLDHVDEARTFLNEARSLDEQHRVVVVEARDRYEAAFRKAIADAMADGAVPPTIDTKLSAIFILSIVNAIDRWYRVDGPMGRAEIVEEVFRFVTRGLNAGEGVSSS